MSSLERQVRKVENKLTTVIKESESLNCPK
jgi:hypothetical protein